MRSNYIRALRANAWCRYLGWLSLLFFPPFCWLVIEYHNFRKLDVLLTFCRTRPRPALFGLLAVTAFFLLALLLLRRGAAACALTGGLSCLVAYINYTKLALNGDYFFPKDIAMAKQAGSLLSFLSGGLPKWMVPALVLLVLWCGALALLGTALPLGRADRLFCAASAIALGAVFCASPSRTLWLLDRFSIQMEATGLQSVNYTSNGFLGAFALNLQQLRVQPPAGYSPDRVEALLARYPGTPSTGEAFDVVVVLSESFCDIRELPGLTFSQNPLTNFDAIRARDNCYSGTLYTNAIGGGTVRPEFELLTGLDTEALPSGSTPYEYVTRPLESYVSNYRDAGYRTVAIHPFIPEFYARDIAYPYLGFDAFYSHRDLEQMAPLFYKRGYVTDQSLEPIMEQLLDGSDGPMFLFAITMENHQPFAPLPEEEIQIQVSSGLLSQSSLDTVTTYVQGLYDADQMLGRLAEYIDSRERPTLLVFFGDHKPTLGDNYAAYAESGLFPADLNYEFQYRKKMYSTPFLICANRELDPGLFSGNRDNELSPCYLLDAVALSTGFQMTPYMQLLAELHETVPYYNQRLTMPITPEVQASVQARQWATYHRLMG